MHTTRSIVRKEEEEEEGVALADQDRGVETTLSTSHEGEKEAIRNLLACHSVVYLEWHVTGKRAEVSPFYSPVALLRLPGAFTAVLHRGLRKA